MSIFPATRGSGQLCSGSEAEPGAAASTTWTLSSTLWLLTRLNSRVGSGATARLINVATKLYDAIVVGSGATGGMAAKELSEAGLSVAVLEAGRKLDPEKDFTEHKWPFD